MKDERQLLVFFFAGLHCDKIDDAQSFYHHFAGHVMGLRPKLLKGFPPLFEAVKGMLPRNLLRNNWLRRQEQFIEH